MHKGNIYGTMRSFKGFIDRVLALQGDSSIKKVPLKCINHIHPDHLDRWICNVLRRGVLDLEIFIDDADGDDDFNYLLPQEMFVSRTLVKLKLGNVEWWPGAEGTFLPKLKTLVVNVWGYNDERTEKRLCELASLVVRFGTCFSVLVAAEILSLAFKAEDR
ncbi:hypothetical protein DY000_02053756 [Brassica cretica]|uniref:FBD domain-containing protein n=1 Tax=Brassica cretica TaxID=69181 RepID=A0ABQ7AJJ6_BRACR|nr:hypothetical protein DY000_02053756 [Brassica cretica]